MRRARHVWVVFGVCLLVAVAAVGWLSYRALESERAEQTAAARIELEENARLALWRIDSTVTSLIAEENANPYLSYRSFYSFEPPRSKSAANKASRPALTPSPLLSAGSPLVKLHFEIDNSGNLHSPSVPPDELVSRAVPSLLSSEQLKQNRARLRELEQWLDPGDLLTRLPADTMPVVLGATGPPPENSLQPSQQAMPSQNNSAIDETGLQQGQASQSDFPQQQVVGQQARSTQEFMARSQAFTNNSANAWVSGTFRQPGDVKPGVMIPLWVGDQLLLVRRVAAEGQNLIQGCWLDWPLVRDQLLASVRDLLPDATLVPADPDPGDELARRMAALPVSLVTGEMPPVRAAGLSPVRLSLVVTWGSLILAALAAALLLSGVLALSERRAAFVSAVTHELRTPLTTFRMYAEMLAEGMVPDEADRRRYLETLHAEANRLSHLVENVLAYARLERGGPGARIGPVPVAELLDHASERLSARAAQAGFNVQMTADDDVLPVRAVADPAAVEQILFNLVDNACKYASSAEDRSLRLSTTRSQGQVLIRLSDAGPGVPRSERKRLFQPFRKSASDAAHSAPGVGLGLALCRRLARDMGGELALDERAAAGASFVLSLKAVEF